MKEKQPVYKKWWFWVIIVVVIIALFPKNKTESVPEASQDSSETVQQDPLEELLRSKVSKNFEISKSDNYIEISYDFEETPYDYTDYVSKALTYFVIIGDYVFDNECNQLRMDMKDETGIITSLIMTKDNYDSVSWKDISYTKGIYEEIAPKFDKFYVESMLMKNVDTNEIMIKTTLGD